MTTGSRGAAELSPIEHGLWSVQLPVLENQPDHVNSYVLAGESGKLTIIDAGDGSPTAWRAMTAALGTVNRSVADVEAFVATHFHPDHVGMAARLASDNVSVRLLLGAADHGGQEAENDLREHAAVLAAADFDSFVDALAAVDELAPPNLPFEQLVDGQQLPFGGGLRVVGTPGHTAGSVCLFDERRGVVFTGDHLLPDMHPGLAAPSAGLPNPVRSYRRSLAALGALRADIALPGHGGVVRDVAARISEHRTHLTARSGRTRDAVESFPQLHAYELAQKLSSGSSWQGLNPLHRWAAYAKTKAHLVNLRDRGEVIESDRAPVWTVNEKRGI